jgi:hypothetical protein
MQSHSTARNELTNKLVYHARDQFDIIGNYQTSFSFFLLETYDIK